MDNYGGVQNYIMNIYRQIDKSKMQFDFLIHCDKHSYFDDEIEVMGGHIYKITHYRDNYFKNIIETFMFFLKNKHKYCAVHIHVTSAARISDGLIARLCGVKNVIFHSHCSMQERPIKYKLTAPLFRFLGAKLLACSQKAGEYFYGLNIEKNNKFCVVKNAIDSGKYKYNFDTRLRIRKEFGIDTQIVVGYVGRFSSEKNADFIIDIFREFHNIYKNSFLLLIGGSGNQTELVRQMVNDYKLDDCVTFTGVRSDVAELLQGIDVYLGPSKDEGLGISFIEAQAAGVLTFASDIVPTETNITSLINYLPLDQSAYFWAESIFAKMKYERVNTQKDVLNSGYDVKDASRILKDIYLRK